VSAALVRAGIRGPVKDWFMDYLRDREIMVKIVEIKDYTVQQVKNYTVRCATG
jgi:hypothetical protein